MFDKETYKREYIRMMDSMRTWPKGEPNCSAVDCYRCPLRSHCDDKDAMERGFFAPELIEIVEQWSKEHPIITNEIKIKEIFGDVNFQVMDPDTYDEWRRQEYKEPKKEKET